MNSEKHFELASVESVKATLTISATIAEWRLLLEGAALYKGGSEDWYRWAANSVLQQFISEIASMLRQAEQAQLTSARRTAAVLDNNFEPDERWKQRG